MAWRDPETAPETGRFLAKFVINNEKARIVVLDRKRTGCGSVIGVAAGLFAWDMGEMIGWHPLPDELD